MPERSDEDELQCVYCRGTVQENDSDVCQPCACAGSIQYMHLSCLAAWLDQGTSLGVCGTCKQPFKLPRQVEERYRIPSSRRPLYYAVYVSGKIGVSLPVLALVGCLWVLFFAGFSVATDTDAYEILQFVVIPIQATIWCIAIQEQYQSSELTYRTLVDLLHSQCETAKSWALLQLLCAYCFWLQLKFWRILLIPTAHYDAAVILTLVIHFGFQFLLASCIRSLLSGDYSLFPSFSSFCIKLQTASVTRDFINDYADRMPIDLHNPYLMGSPERS